MQCKENQSVAQDLCFGLLLVSLFHINAAALLTFGANVPESTTFVKCVAQFKKCGAKLNKPVLYSNQLPPANVHLA